MRRVVAGWAAVLVLTACGSAQPAGAHAWRAGHPDPSGITFDDTAPGLCAVAPRYPDQAPAAIEYLGAVYVQGDRAAVPATTPGSVVAHTGDWTLTVSGTVVRLLTPSAMFTYRSSAGC